MERDKDLEQKLREIARKREGRSQTQGAPCGELAESVPQGIGVDASIAKECMGEMGQEALITALRTELAHWKDCHGATADKLVAVEAEAATHKSGVEEANRRWLEARAELAERTARFAEAEAQWNADAAAHVRFYNTVTRASILLGEELGAPVDGGAAPSGLTPVNAAGPGCVTVGETTPSLITTLRADLAIAWRVIETEQAQFLEARAELEQRRRGEYICPSCGLRQNSNREPPEF